jgi:carbon monoxide dehydrogenase subunit G
MARSEASIEIDRPAAEVFPWLLDPEKRIRWVTGLRSSEPIDDTSYREVVAEHGQRIEATAKVVRHEPPTALDVEMTGRGFTARAESRLAEQNGRTRLTSSFDVQFGGLARFAGGLVARQTQRSLERSLARLKELLESSGSDDAEKEPDAEQE